MKKIKEIDLMKGIGMCLVYLGHCFQFQGLNIMDKSSFFIYVHDTIYSFHMPLFFIISGFLANITTDNKKINLKKYYVGKIKRIFVPYIFINLVDFGARTCFPKVINTQFEGWKSVLLRGTKITWFIYVLFIILFIFPVLEKYIVKKNKLKSLMIVIILILLNYLKVFDGIEILSIDRVAYYLIYFYIGYFLRFLDYKNWPQNNKKYFFVKLILYFLFFICSYKWFRLNLLTSIFFACLGTFVIYEISKLLKKTNILFRMFTFIGINSLIFYLLEGFIAVPCRFVALKTIKNDYILVFIIFITKVLLSSIVIKEIILKNKVLGFIFGRRQDD